MGIFLEILIFAAGFGVISLASKQIGLLFKKVQLPLISGFLFTGILAGPFVLDLISVEATKNLLFVDQFSLAVIAFAAGSMLYLKDLRGRLRSIAWVTIGLVLSTFTLGSLAVFFLSDFIPFLRDMPGSGRLAVSLLAGTILVARSPSSAIAIVNELRAKGPFTQTALGVTMIMDVAVIALFSMNSSIADTLFTNLGFDFNVIFLVFSELAMSLAAGYLLGKFLQLILSSSFNSFLKTSFILLAGFGVFTLSSAIRTTTHDLLSFEVFLEPLLICMVASFLTINFSKHRGEFSKILSKVGPPVYVAFFTLTGASLELDILANAWMIALVLFLVRLGTIFLGSFSGGAIAGVPMSQNRISWMAYVTQAGLGLGLAKEVAVEFPGWGPSFATVMISIIILNQIVGPPLFKWAIRMAKEAHSRADTPDYLGENRAVIFGLEGQSLALARLLRSHRWQVKIATQKSRPEELTDADVDIQPISSLSLDTFRRLKVGQAEAVIAMLSDEENYRICELAYEHFGTENLIVRLNDRANFSRFHELGALIVDPTTAIVSLLDHFVRSPSAASLLLGMDEDQDVVEMEIRNPNLDGMALRDLRLPVNTLVLGVKRRGHLLVSHGYTRLEVGDWVTVVGSPKSLEEVALRFDTNRENALLHLIEKVTAKKFSNHSLETEVHEIITEKDPAPRDRFDRYVEESLILDLDQAMGIEEFFQLVADSMSSRLKMKPTVLLQLLKEREKESSTAISPSLAIPHIIIEGKLSFSLLIARCKEGIAFSDSAPMVHAVFVLAGTRDQRNFHLRALSAIAQIVQDSHFEKMWLRARNVTALRHVILEGKRQRQ